MKTQLLKHTAWSLILAFCFTQVMPVGLAVTNLNELPKGAGVSASRDARAAGSEKLEAESELANSPQRGNSMDFMVNDNPISSAASTTASVKHPGDVKNIELDPKTQPPGNNKNIELDPQVVSKPQSSVINPRVVQAYADALRKTGFQVKAEYVEAMHRYLVTVTDPRADSPALQGKLKYLSFTVNLDGSFKGVLQATYHGKTFNEAQLLFEAMLACPQGGGLCGAGANTGGGDPGNEGSHGYLLYLACHDHLYEKRSGLCGDGRERPGDGPSGAFSRRPANGPSRQRPEI